MVISGKESVGDAAEAFKALEEQWIPDIIDEEELPSFADIKRKTMRDLYGVCGNDKSPKGSVDVAIRPLVDLINVHPCFATLSSCSGRIVLFDPHMKRESEDISQDDFTEESTNVEKGGKGHGGWLLASHEEVEPSVLVELLDRPGEARQTLMFKHEPLLLHVAASSLTRGRQLSSLALQLGFRESGLIVSVHRVTVAIRTHSLALCVPLARQGPLRPSNEYLETLIQESNMRMRSNQEKLRRLYGMVQEQLFRLAAPQQVLCDGTVQKLPALNLWGHATVAVPAESNNGVDILVFGGYGEGPDLSGAGRIGKRCCRSNRVYCLRNRDGTFEDHWRVVRQETVKEKNVFVSKLGAVVLPADFSPREGLDACVLPTENSTIVPVVALWGGRASPGKPFNDLLLYEPFSPQSLFMKPLDIRGTLPEARWGHSFKALSGKGGLMAVLVGGRNEQTTFESVHVLTLITNESTKSHLHWTKLDLSLPPRFHHTTVVSNDLVVVFGGLSDANNILESFSSSYRALSESKKDSQPCVSAFQVARPGDSVAANEVRVNNDENIHHAVGLIGGGGCVVKTTDESGSTKTLVALSGGVSSSAFEMTSILWFEIAYTESAVTMLPRNDVKLKRDDTIGFGSMVHHCCVPLPSALHCAEFVLIGGGAASFGFGPLFAECYFVRQNLQDTGAKQQKLIINQQPKPRTQASTESPQVRFKIPIEEDDNKEQATRKDNKEEPPSKDNQKETTDKDNKEETTNVLFVMAGDAKTLKTALENDGFLDKNYRMTEAGAFQNAGKHIAVPITKDCLTMLETGKRPGWYSLVVARGSQKVPFSTAVLGRQTK